MSFSVIFIMTSCSSSLNSSSSSSSTRRQCDVPRDSRVRSFAKSLFSVLHNVSSQSFVRFNHRRLPFGPQLFYNLQRFLVNLGVHHRVNTIRRLRRLHFRDHSICSRLQSELVTRNSISSCTFLRVKVLTDFLFPSILRSLQLRHDQRFVVAFGVHESLWTRSVVLDTSFHSISHPRVVFLRIPRFLVSDSGRYCHVDTARMGCCATATRRCSSADFFSPLHCTQCESSSRRLKFVVLENHDHLRNQR